MSISMRRQRGMSAYGILVVVAIALFFALTGVKLLPSYLEFFTVKSVMKDVANDPELAGAGKVSILKAVGNRLYINEVRTLSAKDFTFKKITNGNELAVSYEVRKPLFANLDAVMTFSNQVTIPGK